jgi:hypothetical protein
LVVVDLGGPGDVVDAAGPLKAVLGGRLVVGPEAPATRAARLPAVARRRESGVLIGLEAEPLGEQRAARVRRRAVSARGMKALQGQVGGNIGMIGDQRLVASLDDDQLMPEPLGVFEDETAVVAL